MKSPFLIALLVALPTAALAQSPRLSRNLADLARVQGAAPGLPSNNISHIKLGRDGRVWVATGHGLAASTDGVSFTSFERVPQFRYNDFPGLDVKGDTVWSALVYTDTRDIGGESTNTPTGGGYTYSFDNGQTWRYAPASLDLPNNDRPADSLDYCGVKVAVLPIIVPQQNVSYDLAVGDTAVWVASWSAGIRWRSLRGADSTWHRVLLPLAGRDSLVCGDPANRTTLNRPATDAKGAAQPPLYDPRQQINLLGFAICLASDGSIYAGTAGGINRSTDGGRSWRNFRHLNQPQPISGDFVVAIREQPLNGWIWAATWRAEGASEDYGVSWTTNGGVSWTTALTGHKINEIAFDGQAVYAAGDDGLFISTDGGHTWTTQTAFADADGGTGLRPGALYAVEGVATNAVWVGADNGLLRSTDGGRTWRIDRRAEPLASSGPAGYAFPNPFAPDDDRLIRFQYRLPQPGNVTIRVFNFAMQSVRTVVSGAARPAGEQTDPVGWDGRDGLGGRVANGTYFYAITTDGQAPIWGKVLVIE